MNEILSDGAGEIIDPLDVDQMSKAVIKLLDNEDLRIQYGTKAREKVLATYNNTIIGQAMEDHFLQVIDSCSLKD